MTEVSSASWSPDVYGELRRLAAALMRDENDEHTLEPTALVHEAWLRLRTSRNAARLDRREFVHLAAQAMRRILVDHARARGRAKRGGLHQRVGLTDRQGATDVETYVLGIEEALCALEPLDPELVQLVQLKFFAGLTVDEIAEHMDSSPRTVKRRWRLAKAWLHRHVDGPRP